MKGRNLLGFQNIRGDWNCESAVVVGIVTAVDVAAACSWLPLFATPHMCMDQGFAGMDSRDLNSPSFLM